MIQQTGLGAPITSATGGCVRGAEVSTRRVERKCSPKSPGWGTKDRSGCLSLPWAKWNRPWVLRQPNLCSLGCPLTGACHTWNTKAEQFRQLPGNGLRCVAWQDMAQWTFPWALGTRGRWPGLNSLEKGLHDEAKKNSAEWRNSSTHTRKSTCCTMPFRYNSRERKVVYRAREPGVGQNRTEASPGAVRKLWGEMEGSLSWFWFQNQKSKRTK